jgi:hypothetical protein
MKVSEEVSIAVRNEKDPIAWMHGGLQFIPFLVAVSEWDKFSSVTILRKICFFQFRDTLRTLHRIALAA